MRLSLRTAGRIAWRETRSSLTKFLFVVFAVAIGVGALSGVRGFSESVRAMLNSESRTIMAADLSARQFAPPKQEQVGQLDGLASRGVDRTLITETVSMASATTPDATPALVSIKAVDPDHRPCSLVTRLRHANASSPWAAASRMGSGAATVIWTGRVLSRTYLAGLAHDGW